MSSARRTLTVDDPIAMEALGARVAGQLDAGDVVLLTGELGAGKTTFTRGLGAALGVRGMVTSPTFVLARTHPRRDGPPLIHVDAYRMGSVAELDDLDLDYANAIVVVEWGAGLIEHLVDQWLAITIHRPMGAAEVRLPTDAPTGDDDGEAIEPRRVEIVGVGARWSDLGWLHVAGD